MRMLIEFRVWDAIAEHMYYPEGGKYLVSMVGAVCDDSLTDRNGAPNVSYRAKAMLWTGLEDNKGQCIYDGDILIHRGVNRTSRDRYTVEFCFGGFHLCRNLNTYHSSSPFSDRDEVDFLPVETKGDEHWRTTDWEIIGNIFEHPALVDLIWTVEGLRPVDKVPREEGGERQ